ncbi:helix-turn-helix domain containing protein [Mesorhizobium sp. CC13]|uniref:TetR/AcrR family transcriptional regulator n=1 Tax=Mesorhizobium sp. CC13 TaxID=3029194 RepID=UPI00326595A8
MNERGREPAGRLPAPSLDADPKLRLYRAAVAVALEHGFGKVTLDAVAREAGFSKGGLLHHFASKNALIRSMLAHYSDPANGQDQGDVGVDPLAVAALVAAAEDTSLLGAIGDSLDVSSACEPEACTGETGPELARCLANRLRLRGA